MRDDLYIVFDKMPDSDDLVFVGVEDESGASVRAGEWVRRDDGLVALRVGPGLEEAGATS